MKKWHHLFLKTTGLSSYVWVVFYILPFYFIFRSSSTYEVVIGIILILLFFACYLLSFVSKGWLVYFWTSVQILTSITMTLMFGYVYFALFLAFFIGNIQNRIGFATLYTIHLVTTIAAVNFGFVTNNPVFFNQLPFVLVSLIGVVLLPVTTYDRNKRDKLQGQLEHANKRISELVKLEERQRIARDLHDTIGQKLALIGLKSDLAGKLVSTQPTRAQAEINDVRQTARTALQEVRDLVTEMRGVRLVDEMFRVAQILKAAEIDLLVDGDPGTIDTSMITENVLSMCLKEAVTNVVKHSGATKCLITIEPSPTELVVRIQDNGVGLVLDTDTVKGNGLRGMKERIEFVNGVMEMVTDEGMTVVFRVPAAFKQPEKETVV